MRKTVFTVCILCVSLLLLTSTGFCYDSKRAARHVFTAFDDATGKGEAIGEVYRLHATRMSSYTKYDELSKETINGRAWSIEVEILSMERAGAGLYFIYSDRKGLGAEIAKDGTVSFKYMEMAPSFEYMEMGRGFGIRTCRIAKSKLSGVSLPLRLGIYYNIYTTDFSVSIDGKSVLVGKTDTSSFVPSLIAFDMVGIKAINDILDQQGYCDFGSIALKVE